MRAPWEPMPDEEPEEYSRFTRWLHSDETISAWARAEGENLSTTLALAARRRWKARKAAHVAMLASEASEAARDAVRALAVEHAHALAQARTRLVEAILADDGPTITRKDAIALLPKIVEAERLVAGEDTARIGVHRDLTALSDEDLEILDRASAILDQNPNTH